MKFLVHTNTGGVEVEFVHALDGFQVIVPSAMAPSFVVETSFPSFVSVRVAGGETEIRVHADESFARRFVTETEALRFNGFGDISYRTFKVSVSSHSLHSVETIAMSRLTR